MSFRALHIDDTVVARIAALSALGLIAFILFGFGQPAKAAAPSTSAISSAGTIQPRCSGF